MYDVIVLGSGPAGLTAAIYTSRARLKTLVIAGTLWGGQLMLTKEVENFPGFEKAILGPKLMESMRIQAENSGAEIIIESATRAELKSKPFRISVEKKVFEAKVVIIATGASAKWLGLASENRLRGKGVSACATCDGPFFRNKKVVVVGGGDTAMEEALFLSKIASEVKIIHRREILRACNFLQERVFSNPKIKFIWSSTVKEILGTDKVEGIKVENVNSKQETIIECEAVFLAIGYIPNTNLFRNQITLDENGYIKSVKDTNTNIEGVFVAGDVVDFRYRQAIVAAGSGCKAALDAEKYMLTLK